MQAKKHIQCLKFYAAQFIQEGKNIWSHIYLRKFIISGELSKQVIIEICNYSVLLQGSNTL